MPIFFSFSLLPFCYKSSHVLPRVNFFETSNLPFYKQFFYSYLYYCLELPHLINPLYSGKCLTILPWVICFYQVIFHFSIICLTIVVCNFFLYLERYPPYFFIILPFTMLSFLPIFMSYLQFSEINVLVSKSSFKEIYFT